MRFNYRNARIVLAVLSVVLVLCFVISRPPRRSVQQRNFDTLVEAVTESPQTKTPTAIEIQWINENTAVRSLHFSSNTTPHLQLQRLLEVAREADLFSLDVRAHNNEHVKIAITLGERSFQAAFVPKQIETNPAAKLFLTLADLYAQPSTTTDPVMENPNATP
jgi:hypothetical protein